MTREDRMREALEAALSILKGSEAHYVTKVVEVRRKLEEAIAAEPEPSIIAYKGPIYQTSEATIEQEGVAFERGPAFDSKELNGLSGNNGIEWIEWMGGERPTLFSALVDVKTRDSRTLLAVKSNGLAWAHVGRGDDIVAYRRAARQPAEVDIAEGVKAIAKVFEHHHFVTHDDIEKAAESFVKACGLKPRQ